MCFSSICLLQRRKNMYLCLLYLPLLSSRRFKQKYLLGDDTQILLTRFLHRIFFLYSFIFSRGETIGLYKRNILLRSHFVKWGSVMWSRNQMSPGKIFYYIRWRHCRFLFVSVGGLRTSSKKPWVSTEQEVKN